MKNHIIGESMLVHKVKPLPQDFHDRSSVLVGNKYQNEPLWQIYKDTNVQTFVANQSSTTTTIEGHEGVEVSGLAYDFDDIIGLRNYDMVNGSTWYFVRYVVTKNGYLCFIHYVYNSTTYENVYRIARSKNPVVDETTDYQYLYDNAGSILTPDDFTYQTIPLYRGSNPRYVEVMSARDHNGNILIGVNRLRYSTWYADDRNGTNQQFLDQIVMFKYYPESNTVSLIKASHYLAPRSLVKTPSSDPWAASNNYAFDINNIDYMSIRPRYEQTCLDTHNFVPFVLCYGRVKEFYTVGSPATPAFNYRDIEYWMPLGGSPVVTKYLNGGPVTTMADLIPNSGCSMFNNRYIRSSNALSGTYSTISGVEIIQPDINFKTTDQLSKVHTAYDFNGKYIPGVSTFYLGHPEQSITDRYFDSNCNGLTHFSFLRKDMNLPVAVCPIRYPENSTTYLPNYPFILDQNGFRFVGDDTYYNTLKSYQTFEENTYYAVCTYGLEYIRGGEILQQLTIKHLQNGGTITKINSSHNYQNMSIYVAGVDPTGYYVIMDTAYITSATNTTLRLQRTKTVGTSGHIIYYRVSPDLTEIIGYRDNDYNSSIKSATDNRFLTKDWTETYNGIAHGLSMILINPEKSKDTFTLPAVHHENADYRYITKITDTA